MEMIATAPAGRLRGRPLVQALRSIESWLFERDPNNGSWYNPHIPSYTWVVKSPIYPKQCFIAQTAAGSTVFNKGNAEWKQLHQETFLDPVQKNRLVWTKLIIYIDEKSMTSKINFHQMSSCHAVALRCQISCQTLWRMMLPGQLCFRKGKPSAWCATILPFLPESREVENENSFLFAYINIYHTNGKPKVMPKVLQTWGNMFH